MATDIGLKAYKSGDPGSPYFNVALFPDYNVPFGYTEATPEDARLYQEQIYKIRDQELASGSGISSNTQGHLNTINSENFQLFLGGTDPSTLLSGYTTHPTRGTLTPIDQLDQILKEESSGQVARVAQQVAQNRTVGDLSATEVINQGLDPNKISGGVPDFASFDFAKAGNLSSQQLSVVQGAQQALKAIQSVQGTSNQKTPNLPVPTQPNASVARDTAVASSAGFSGSDVTDIGAEADLINRFLQSSEGDLLLKEARFKNMDSEAKAEELRRKLDSRYKSEKTQLEQNLAESGLSFSGIRASQVKALADELAASKLDVDREFASALLDADLDLRKGILKGVAELIEDAKKEKDDATAALKAAGFVVIGDKIVPTLEARRFELSQQEEARQAASDEERLNLDKIKAELSAAKTQADIEIASQRLILAEQKLQLDALKVELQSTGQNRPLSVTELIALQDRGVDTTNLSTLADVRNLDDLGTKQPAIKNVQFSAAIDGVRTFTDKLNGWGVPPELQQDVAQTLGLASTKEKINDDELKQYLISKYGISTKDADEILKLKE